MNTLSGDILIAENGEWILIVSSPYGMPIVRCPCGCIFWHSRTSWATDGIARTCNFHNLTDIPDNILITFRLLK